MTRFLNRLWRPSNSSTPEQPEPQLELAEPLLPAALGADEYVARFVFSERHIDKKFRNVKWQGFMPMLYEGNFETSVCRNTGIQESRVWELSRVCRHPMQALARADVGIVVAHEALLMAQAAPQPNYAEHAVILGWPPITNDDKSPQMMAATLLATSAQTISPPQLLG